MKLSVDFSRSSSSHQKRDQTKSFEMISHLLYETTNTLIVREEQVLKLRLCCYGTGDRKRDFLSTSLSLLCVSVRGHYRFTRNQIPPRKQLTGKIGVYTRVPIQSIPPCVRIGCFDFTGRDRFVDETKADLFPVKNVKRSLITILEMSSLILNM